MANEDISKSRERAITLLKSLQSADHLMLQEAQDLYAFRVKRVLAERARQIYELGCFPQSSALTTDENGERIVKKLPIMIVDRLGFGNDAVIFSNDGGMYRCRYAGGGNSPFLDWINRQEVRSLDYIAYGEPVLDHMAKCVADIL